MNVPERRLRSREEIQRAHDVLWSQVTGETPPVFDPDQRLFVLAALDVLCWVLHHDHSDGFTRSLATIEHTLAEVGIVFDDVEEFDDTQ